MRHLAIIPARSGSKGLVNKNVKPLLGKPLLAYSVEAAIQSKIFDEIIVSTDSQEYANIAKSYGASVPFMRDEELSNDYASSWDVVKDILHRYENVGEFFDTVCLLQPTSPLRDSDHIRSAYDMLNHKKAESIISVTEMEHSPQWTNTLPNDLSMEGFIKSDIYNRNRQSLEPYYRLNGALYIVKTAHLLQNDSIYGKKSFAYIMAADKSIDIDTLSDFIIAEAYLKMDK